MVMYQKMLWSRVVQMSWVSTFLALSSPVFSISTSRDVNATMSAVHLHSDRLRHQALRGNATGDSISAPKVFFLFMTVTDVQEPDVWQAFFEDVPERQYRAFVHCRDHDFCKSKLAVSNPLKLTQVATVPTSYCKDLVSAMVQLLEAALLESSSARDKFMFISDSDLPVKKFPEVYAALTNNEDSDICIRPKSHWEEVPYKIDEDRDATTGRALIVKHHQWAALNREHAGRLAEHWQWIHLAEHMQWPVPVMQVPRSGAGSRRFKLSLQSPPKLCADEWGPFASIFGALPLGTAYSDEVDLDGFAAGPLRLTGQAAVGAQGVCPTFVYFNGGPGTHTELAKALMADSPRTRLSCYPKCQSSHPAEFIAISDRGLQALKASPFLFARKFKPGVVSTKQFRRVILNQVGE